MSEIAHRPAALRLSLGLIVAFALVIAHAWQSGEQRLQLEKVSETTAVGDRQLYPVGVGIESPPVSFQGRPLAALGAPGEVRETKVTRAGFDDSGKYRIYVPRDTEAGSVAATGASADPASPLYLLKTGVNQFQKMQPAEKPK